MRGLMSSAHFRPVARRADLEARRLETIIQHGDIPPLEAVFFRNMIEINKLIGLVISHEGGNRGAVSQQSQKNTLESHLRRLPDPERLRLLRGRFDAVDCNRLDAELRLGTLFEGTCREA